MEQLEIKITDGGRKQYFKGENVGDCVVRAIALAACKDYKIVYDELKKDCGYTPRDGVKTADIKKYMQKHGYKWIATSGIGKGTTTHLAKNEIPMHGRIICRCSKHLVAVIDGVVNDTYDCRRDGSRAVYGYWVVK